MTTFFLYLRRGTPMITYAWSGFDILTFFLHDNKSVHIDYFFWMVRVHIASDNSSSTAIMLKSSPSAFLRTQAIYSSHLMSLFSSPISTIIAKPLKLQLELDAQASIKLSSLQQSTLFGSRHLKYRQFAQPSGPLA